VKNVLQRLGNRLFLWINITCFIHLWVAEVNVRETVYSKNIPIALAFTWAQQCVETEVQ
jgi:hypothetical protein